MQELGTFLGPQNRTQGRCGMQYRLSLTVNYLTDALVRMSVNNIH